MAFFDQLILFCDDNGIIPICFDTFKVRIFPGKDITTDQIKEIVFELVQNEVLYQFNNNNKQYLYVLGWHDEGSPTYQSIEQSRRQIFHPTPDLSTVSFYLRRNCGTHATKEGKGKESNIYKLPTVEIKGEALKLSTAFPTLTTNGQVFCKIPLADGSEYPMCEYQINQLEIIYPEIDVRDQIARLTKWYEDNPRRRKRIYEIIDHINRCLKSEQRNPKAKKQMKHKKHPDLTPIFSISQRIEEKMRKAM